MRWLDTFGKLAKATAIVLTGAIIIALLALRSARIVDAAQYAGLPRYHDADAELAYQGSSKRIVFLGDSITDFWDLNRSFQDQPFVNRGIGGQTTSQMVLRFHQDVVDLRPSSVVILAGINDIGAGSSLEFIESNYASMAEMARDNHIAVYFGSVLPVARSKKDFPPEKIKAVNQWLRSYCDNRQTFYVDYWSAMADKDGLLISDLSQDGIQPNISGYKIMQSVLLTTFSRWSPAGLAQ